MEQKDPTSPLFYYSKLHLSETVSEVLSEGCSESISEDPQNSLIYSCPLATSFLLF